MNAQESEINIRRRLVEDKLKTLGFDVSNLNDESTRKLVAEEKTSPYSISNALLFIISISVFYFTDFASVVLYDNRIDRLWFNIGALFFIIFAAIAFFHIVYLTYWRKLRVEDWDVYYPALIPIATASFGIASICVTVGLWPVYRFFTPVILFCLFMGFVVITAAIPSW